MVSAGTRALVWRRAEGRCEYCRVHQDDFDFFTFHVEHIIPRQHGGTDDPENLCLACRECNSAKGTNLAGLLRGKIVPLFHPRRQVWSDHFRWRGRMVVGLTPTGRATITALQMNRPSILFIRHEESERGRHPPPT